MKARWVRQVVTVGLVAGGVSGGLVATAPPAEAWVLGCPTHQICVFSDFGLRGLHRMYDGYRDQSNLGPGLHVEASSWINANLHTPYGIGEWRGGIEFVAQRLPPGWYEDNLGSVNFNDKADFVLDPSKRFRPCPTRNLCISASVSSGDSQ